MDLVMKRNDIGDTPTCFVARAGLATRRVHPSIMDDHAALCRQALRTTVTGQPVRHTEGYAGTPTIRNARSLWFPFHSPGAPHRFGMVALRYANALRVAPIVPH